MESAQPPVLEQDKQSLQIEMGLNYRQDIGELIFLMITCRPDISFPLIKLSQYSVNPAKEHYEAQNKSFDTSKLQKRMEYTSGDDIHEKISLIYHYHTVPYKTTL